MKLKITDTVVCARTDVIGYRTSFVIEYVRSSIYWNIYVFMDNPFQAHILEQSYHQTKSSKQKKYIIQSKKGYNTQRRGTARTIPI